VHNNEPAVLAGPMGGNHGIWKDRARRCERGAAVGRRDVGVRTIQLAIESALDNGRKLFVVESACRRRAVGRRGAHELRTVKRRTACGGRRVAFDRKQGRSDGKARPPQAPQETSSQASCCSTERRDRRGTCGRRNTASGKHRNAAVRFVERHTAELEHTSAIGWQHASLRRGSRL
jgi:hypothetical protein